MVLCLGLITLAASTGLGLVYGLTRDSIEEARNSSIIRALSAVIADFDNNPAKDVAEITLDGLPLRVFAGTRNGQPSGYAVETATRTGYSGMIRMMVGFTAAGEIYNIVVLEHNETPGLGSKITEPDNPLLLSFRGNNPSDMNLAVRRDGGDVDAITASTITSRAYIDAVERAMRAFRAVALGVVEEGVNHIAAVLPRYDSATAREIVVEGDTVIVNTAMRGGRVVGFAIQTESHNGWRGGTIRLMVGFLPDGTINDISVIDHSETPGFGAAIDEPNNALAAGLRGRNAAEIKWGLAPAADGSSGATGTETGTASGTTSGTADASSGATGTETETSDAASAGDVDGITGSTVTSNAYIEAVRLAYEAFVMLKTM